MNIASILWWAVYITVALVIQQHIPGVDALTPGFLLALQEKNKTQILALFFLFTFIQEGAGTLDFGMAMLWYGGQIILFHTSARLFVADNALFITMLSTSLGGLRAILFCFMCAIQSYPVDYRNLAHDTLAQILIIPIIWGIATRLRGKGMAHVD